MPLPLLETCLDLVSADLSKWDKRNGHMPAASEGKEEGSDEEQDEGILGEEERERRGREEGEKREGRGREEGGKIRGGEEKEGCE